MRRAVRWGILAGALAISVAPSAAHADDKATREAEARFQEGLARAKAGDFEAARLSFAQAYAVVHKPAIVWNLALSEEKTSHPVDALAHFKQFLKDAPATDPDRARASKHIEDLEQQVGRIEVQAPAGAQIAVDGAASGIAPLAEPIDVTPGSHHVEVRTPQGETRAADADAMAGRVSHVSLMGSATPAGAGAGAGGAPQPAPAVTEQQGTGPAPDATAAPPAPTGDRVESGGAGGTFWDARGITVVTAAGLAVVSAGMAVGFGVASSNDADSAASLRGQNPSCSGNAASSAGCQQLQSVTDSQHNEHVLSTAFWVTGGVLAAGAVAAYFLWPHATASTSGGASVTTAGLTLVPSVGPGGAGAAMVGSF